MKRMMRVAAGLAVVLALAGTARAQVGAEGVTAALEVTHEEGMVRAGLAWLAEADTFYEIYSTTNLAGPWELAVADPVNSTNLVGQMELLSAERSRFFQVRKLDTQGPAITARSPAQGDANVGMAAVLSVSVSDPSGVDADTISVSINGGAPLAPDAAGFSVTDEGFAYDPAIAGAGWGVHGGTVTVSFACADLKGNSTFEEWSFYLEVPVIVADNVLVLGSEPAQSYAVARTDPVPGLLATAPEPVIRPLVAGLAIEAIYPDRIIVSYTGDAHGIPMGALIANNDFDNIFYRKVTGLSDNTTTKRVTVYTEDVPFTHLITDGSFDSGDFVFVGGEGVSALGVTPLDTFETSKRYSASGNYSVSRNWGPVTFSGSAGYSMNGGMDFSTCVEWMKLKHMTAGVYASLGVDVNGALVFDAATAPVAESLPLFGESLLLVRVKGLIYGIPVVVSLYLDLDLCVESESTGAVTLTASATAGASFTNRVTFSGGVWKQEPERDAVTFTCDLPRPTLSGGMEGYLHVYLKPKLTLRLYEAVGVGIDYRRGPMVTGDYSVSEGRFHFALYDRRSVNLSLWCTDLPGVLEGVIDPGNLPEWNLWTAPDELKIDWYWPEIPESSPVFTRHPAGGEYAAGAAVTLTASASGSPAPTYQWYQNGKALPGRTAAALSLTMGASAVGSYHCAARNRIGSSTSQTAALALPASAPAGMALIPAGSFLMGDHFGDSLIWDELEFPVHTVYVSAFYMDKTEVTWGKWKEVRTYAAANGYDIGSVGAGKADNHPVHSVNWYDCVKWLNARSQKEGLAPCYRRGGAVYKEGEYDDITCDWSAGGYRLPTEAEWEKAARGGLSGKRFPWGDTISHSRANYYASPWYWYDTNGYEGYHPSYESDWPYTSPVGVFVANGYGLHDMAGNVWEWCWDWFDCYPPGSVNNPRGPSAPSPDWGSDRVIRGGSWYNNAIGCRAASRTYAWPDGRNHGVGFRAVRPPGQQ